MSTRRLVKIKDEQRLKLKNDNYVYDFSAAESADISDSFHKLLLHSSKAKVSITENVFLTAGKYFNIRMTGSKDPQPYNVVLSQSPSFKRIKHSLISGFMAEFPTFRAESASGPEKIVESVEQVLVTVQKNEFRKKSVDNSREDQLEPPGFTQSRLVPDLMDEYLPICFKTSDAQAKEILNIPRNKSALDVRGPFGPGLGFTRYSFGHNLLFAQGSAAFAVADFVDFLLRYYIYMYSIKKSARNGSQQYKDSVNPFEDDFEYTFNNKPHFVIYLALKTPSDFEGLFAADLHLITQIEQELNLGVVNNVVVRLPAPPASYSGKYPGIRFETAKAAGKEFEKFLTATSLSREDLSKKVERAVAIGHPSFVKEVREGLTTHGLPHEKFKSL